MHTLHPPHFFVATGRFTFAVIMVAPPVDRQAMIHALFKMMDADDSLSIDESEFLSIFSDKEVCSA